MACRACRQEFNTKSERLLRWCELPQGHGGKHRYTYSPKDRGGDADKGRVSVEWA